MVKDRSVAVLATMLCLAACASAQVTLWGDSTAAPAPGRPTRSPQTLVSHSVADRFLQIAQEIARAEPIEQAQADQAIILLLAAQRLNRESLDAEPLLLELALRQTGRDYSQQVLLWLQSYVAEGVDHVLISRAIQYLLARQNAPEARQQILEQLVSRIGNKNVAIDSELATSLGILAQQRGDAKAARFYLLQAYQSNPYNPMAFAKLAELAPNDIGAATYLEHLRLLVRENPLDLDAVTNLARYAERLELYDVAAGAYRYGAELFQYLYPGRPWPPEIYLPWAIACYNSERQQDLCGQIAEHIRSRGSFDILLEAVAGRAAARAGRQEEARRLFRQAEQLAGQFLEVGPGRTLMGPQGTLASARELSAKHFAWFYCFADPNAEMALDWANKGYAIEPNSPATTSLLAYALGMNGQLEWAKSLVASHGKNQISELVQGQILLSQGDKAGAIAMLKTSIARDPGSLAAERAKEILREQGAAHAAPISANDLMAQMSQDLRHTFVPQFTAPDKRIELRFSHQGGELTYGGDIEAMIAIANKGLEPLVISDNGLFTGRLRVDAKVRGDLTRQIPNLLSRTIRTSLTVPPGEELTTTLQLNTGSLQKLLLSSPQASLEIDFALYVDPVVGDDGVVRNRLADLKPAVLSVRRPGMQLSGQYVRSRFKTVATGQQAQKLRTARLFTGLLKEQQAMAQHGALYAYRNSAWLPGLLRSSLLDDSGLLLGEGEGDWVVRAHAMADLLALPIDQELATVVARSLNHPHWPVRLMAVYLLATSSQGDFGKVLDWVGQQDANELVRSLAMSLRSAGSKNSVVAPGQGE